jgi:hypothetical protein
MNKFRASLTGFWNTVMIYIAFDLNKSDVALPLISLVNYLDERIAVSTVDYPTAVNNHSML